MKESKYTTLTYYEPSVFNGKIIVDKITNKHVSKKHLESIKSKRFLTREVAKNAIIETLDKALEKKGKIVRALKDLQESEDFYIDYTMDGDTYGIYEDHLDINFEMNNFNFNFSIDI